MKKYFDVEVLGKEVSVYGGIDGHEVGTKVIGHWLGDIMELEGNFKVQVSVSSISGKTRVVFKGNKYVVEPITRNIAIHVPFSAHDVVKAIMGVDRVHDNFDEYFRIYSDLDLNGIPLEEFKEILKKIC
jgi:hypothetical protein